ncbi:hypothetical protein MRX96_006067 [Rhipicephalus microplus]
MRRVMRRTFDGLPRIATYMDDVGQGATTVREALDMLNEALWRVVINGSKMDLRKCQLIQDKVSFLGYVISAEGRTLDESIRIQSCRCREVRAASQCKEAVLLPAAR